MRVPKKGKRLTLFVEKSIYKSPINDVIRFIAIVESVAEQKPGKLQLVSSNTALNDALSDLCKNSDIAYEWKQPPGKLPLQLDIRWLYRVLPHPVRALISLVFHVWGRWPLRKAEKAGWFSGDNALFVCSYFFTSISSPN